MNDSMQEERYAQYLDYLYTTAHIKYGDCPEIDTLVQESIVAFFVREQKGEPIAHPKAMLEGILRHKYNDWLRQKYRNRLISFEADLPGDISAEEFDYYVNQIKAHSYYDTGVEITAEDKLLTLTTCAYNSEEQRFVVVAKLKK